MLEIGFAPPEAREEVAQFMNRVFVKAKWDIEGWRRLIDGRWSGPEGRYAITVRDGGEIVGVLGLVPSTRQTAEGPRRAADMTSWYVLKPYRGGGVGQRMLALATSDPEVTITNFSSAKAAVPVLEKAGFQVLERERLIWHAGDDGGLEVQEDPRALGTRLPAKDRKLVEDHRGLPVYFRTVETPDGLCTLGLYPQKKHDDYVTHETMYVSDQPVFARYAGRIARSVLPARGAVLSLDRRFAAAGIAPDEVHALAIPRYYYPGQLKLPQIDMLYSECLLLGIKMH